MKSSIGKHLRIAGNIKPYDDLTPENACGKLRFGICFFLGMFWSILNIPDTQTHTIYFCGIFIIFTYIWLGFYGKLIGKYTSPMYPMGYGVFTYILSPRQPRCRVNSTAQTALCCAPFMFFFLRQKRLDATETVNGQGPYLRIFWEQLEVTGAAKKKMKGLLKIIARVVVV